MKEARRILKTPSSSPQMTSTSCFDRVSHWQLPSLSLFLTLSFSNNRDTAMSTTVPFRRTLSPYKFLSSNQTFSLTQPTYSNARVVTSSRVIASRDLSTRHRAYLHWRAKRMHVGKFWTHSDCRPSISRTTIPISNIKIRLGRCLGRAFSVIF